MASVGEYTDEEHEAFLAARAAQPAEVRMAEDIVRAMSHLGEEMPGAVAAHLRKFWDPAMRDALLQQWRAGEIEDPDLIAVAQELDRRSR